jgi:hypothetical protein
MLSAGFAKTRILPPGEVHLIGLYARRPRLGRCRRDPLQARALALACGEVRAVVVACDLLCISAELHRGLGRAVAELGPAGILLGATHTHSSFGGYFRSAATSAMLGTPQPAVFDFLIERLAGLVRAALADLAPAEAAFGRAELPGLTASRRQADGPCDDALGLLCIERAGRRPIHLLSASGHPVVVAEREPHSLSADYPGALCTALEAAGVEPLFLPAALGGLSILFPEFHMSSERHLALLTGLLLQAHDRARAALAPIAPAAGGLRVAALRVPAGRHRTQVLAGLGRWGRLADGLLAPLRSRLTRAAKSALPNRGGVPLHLLQLGDWLLLGAAAEMGPGLVQALRAAATEAGLRAQVVSLLDGYAGYCHLPATYAHWPEPGYRWLALYENALALFGHHLGRRIVTTARQNLPLPQKATDRAGGSAGERSSQPEDFTGG